MNAHQLDAHGVIVNTVVVESLDALPNLVDAKIGGSIGDQVVGGTVFAMPRAPIVPQKVTRRQALSALRIKNITAAMVEVAIMAMPVSQLQIDLALIDFRESLEFEYDWPLIVPLCTAMGLNRDELFILAGSL